MSSDARVLQSHLLSTSAREHLLPPIGIAVLGTTGSGKSSFINIASGSHLRSGNDLTSCTTEVELSDEFILDGRRVFLIDTPGFDDTDVSDAEILEKIAAFLAKTYEKGSKLAGIIYVHRVSDDRFTGASARNFRMFRKLCGESAMKNVMLVTNMWGRVENWIEEAHEKELLNKHFKPALDKGAQTARHSNTAQSAHDIIRRIMKNDPAPLLIQKELVDEGRSIDKTSAGESVNEELNKALAFHKAEMEALRKDMHEALAMKDKKMAEELKEVTDGLEERMRRMRADGANMAARYEEERKAVQKKIEDMERKMRQRDFEARQQALEERMRQINELAMENWIQQDPQRMQQIEQMMMECAITASIYEEERKAAERTGFRR